MAMDPELLKEYVDEICKILAECKISLTEFGITGEPKVFDYFATNIEKALKPSHSLGFTLIGDLCKSASDLALKSAHLTDKDQMHSVHSLLSQLVKELEESLWELEQGIKSEVTRSELLYRRLEKAKQSLNQESVTGTHT